MEKIKQSTLLKVIAILLLPIAAIVGVVSGIFFATAYCKNYYNPIGEELLKRNVIREICWEYDQMAYDWYDSTLNNYNGYCYSDAYYEDYFSEENTNYFFTLEPVDEEDKAKYPTLNNYWCDDYQYINEEFYEQYKYGSGFEISFNITIDDIIEGSQSDCHGYHYEDFYYEGNYFDSEYLSEDYESEEIFDDVDATATEEPYEYDEYSTEENYDDGYEEYNTEEDYKDGTYSSSPIINYYLEQSVVNETLLKNYVQVYTYETYDGIHVILCDGEIDADYCISSNEKYNKEYQDFIEDLEGKYDYCSAYSYYDVYEEKLYINYDCADYIALKLTSYVKSDLTAQDAFYTSINLRYLEPLMDWALPIFIISCVVALLSLVYIIISAGHIKGSEGISLNKFHRTPLDIVFIAFLITILLAMYGWDIINMASNVFEYILGILAFYPTALVGTIMISTVSARVKVGGIFANTIICKVLKWCGKHLKKMLTKVKNLMKYMRENVSMYWKWVGVYVIISIVQMIISIQTWYDEIPIFLWIIEKGILIVILSVAIVNMNKLKKGAEKIAGGSTDYEIDTENMLWEFKHHGDNLNKIRDGIQLAVEDRIKSEKMKTELITNVSHDIKTPLTSIINYVDLLSKEELENEKAVEYLEVLERQSGKLKKLIQDLIDASKASTGNMPVALEKMDIRVLLDQIIGEASEKFEERGLKPIVNYYLDEAMVMADGKHLWRVFDNLVNNILKYAQNNTRVYIDIEGVSSNPQENDNIVASPMVKVSIKNISKEELNITGDELMERFVRGDSSRNTEGSGLGLSIARSLMDIQNGNLEIIVDGDLFKVVLLLVRA